MLKRTTAVLKKCIGLLSSETPLDRESIDKKIASLQKKTKIDLINIGVKQPSDENPHQIPENQRLFDNQHIGGDVIGDFYSNRRIFKSCLFVGPFISNIKFIGCEFQNCIFLGVFIRQCEFFSCSLIQCSMVNSGFLNGKLENCKIDNLKPYGFKEIKLSNLMLVKVSIENQDMNLIDVGGSYAEELTLKRVRNLKHLAYRGLPRSERPWLDQIIEPELSKIDKFVNWEKLKAFSKLPLFSISYFALLATPAVLWIMAIYNNHVDITRSFLEKMPPPWDVAATNLIRRLHPLPLPALSFWFFVGTVAIAIGSSVFALFCPDRIKEFTKRGWLDQIRGSILAYDPLSLSMPWARITCGITLLAGSVIVFCIISYKIISVGVYIWRYGGKPWPF